MTDTRPPAPNEIDEMLAKFTDELLAGTAPEIPVESSEPEMLALQKMVIRLNQVVGHNQPSEALSQKIWSSLATEWKKEGLAVQPESLWQRWTRPVLALRDKLMESSQRPLYVSIAAIAIVIVLIILAPGLSDSPNPLTGSAGGGELWFPIILLIGLVVVGVIWWLSRKR